MKVYSDSCFNKEEVSKDNLRVARANLGDKQKTNKQNNTKQNNATQNNKDKQRIQVSKEKASSLPKNQDTQRKEQLRSPSQKV